MTYILGVGACPCGSSPAGIGLTIPGNKQKQNVFESRYINPVSKDFAYNDDGTMQTMPNVRQRVLMCLLTTKSSSTADLNFGNEVPFIKSIDNYFNDSLKEKIKLALNNLINIERLITIDDIIINEDTIGRVTYQVSYTDLTNGQQDNIAISRG